MNFYSEEEENISDFGHTFFILHFLHQLPLTVHLHRTCFSHSKQSACRQPSLLLTLIVPLHFTFDKHSEMWPNLYVLQITVSLFGWFCFDGFFCFLWKSYQLRVCSSFLRILSHELDAPREQQFHLFSHTIPTQAQTVKWKWKHLIALISDLWYFRGCNCVEC